MEKLTIEDGEEEDKFAVWILGQDDSNSVGSTNLSSKTSSYQNDLFSLDKDNPSTSQRKTAPDFNSFDEAIDCCTTLKAEGLLVCAKWKL